MIALLLTLGFILLIAAINGITEAFDEAFSGDWMSFDDKPTDRERLEMENTEYDWGHNIKNYMEE
jgi:hypothetical protein